MPNMGAIFGQGRKHKHIQPAQKHKHNTSTYSLYSISIPASFLSEMKG